MSFHKYLTRKPIGELFDEIKHNAFDRTLGPFQLVLIGIGAVIGAGIFVLAGQAASEHAGPAVTLSFILGGIACAMAGLCYAELSSAIPISGGAYSFIYASLGELFAWLIMGMMMLTYGLGAASVASGWSGYMVSFLSDYHIHCPPQLCHTTGKIVTLADGSTVAAWIDLPAFLIVLALTMVVYRGAQTAAWLNALIVTIKMVVLTLFIAIGFFYINPANWNPYIPENTGVFGEFGYSGIFGGTAVVFLAFTGFDAVATTAQEAKNPQRDLPIGILVSLLICTLFYFLISAVLTGIVNYTQLSVPQPMALAVDAMKLPWFSVVLKVGALCGLTSVILVLIYAAVRILYAVTYDGLLPRILIKQHPKYHIPYILTLLLGITIAILSSTTPLDKLVKLSNFGTLVTFAAVCFATLFLRYSRPKLHRGFRCPLMPFIPLCGIILFSQIIFTLPNEIFFYVGIWIVALLCVYFSYSQFHSVLLKEIKEGTVKENLD